MVKDLLFHPEYDPKRIFNNLAILITESNFVYQQHIGPVCLPRPNENFEGQVKMCSNLLSLYPILCFQPEGSCWSSGWGATDNDEFQGFYSNSLKKIDMPIVSQVSKHQRLSTILLRINFRMNVK